MNHFQIGVGILKGGVVAIVAGFEARLGFGSESDIDNTLCFYIFR